jgi:hypothetical protein
VPDLTNNKKRGGKVVNIGGSFGEISETDLVESVQNQSSKKDTFFSYGGMFAPEKSGTCQV